ncbi:hypothetical protein EYB26_001142 [Talaromyces marneffei]|uniref:uncharacterized protein n=1 Tax=Talaromyces marneffei TaxID=37727 RepID=UPI0012A8DCF7|nr:uncharacterized protein EYB26_001142 [Talaromyces marneffei]QGA13492.1 hypothetical protein EYB26_001142 [Talaromyces marneffei]
MTFLKTHLRRNSSERLRFTNLGTSVMHRKSESSSSRAASVPDTEQQDYINSEVEHLFQQATDTNEDHASSRFRDSKSESSLFHKLMKRKDSQSKSAGLTAGIRRSFSQRVRPKTSVDPKPSDETVTRGCSPDFASETGYDSDAAFIASPRFSEQSWDSVYPSSPVAIDRTITSLNQVLSEDMKSCPGANEDNEVTALSSMRLQPNILSISKRRKKVENPVDKDCQTYSRWVPSINLGNEGEGTKNTPADSKGAPRKSRFTELFDHPGLQDEPTPQQPRKVSIGWMSEGKRYGYGYNFVDNDATTTSCATDGRTDNSSETDERESVADQDEESNTSYTTAVPANDSSETEETGSSTDATLFDEGQDADLLGQASVETSSEPEAKESAEKEPSQSIARNSSEPELVLSSYQRGRWTLFPSYTRVERNKSTDVGDTVIVRDFCPKASPDRPQQEDNDEGKKHHLIANAIRQGFHDTFLWVIGLGKREIARYHAGLQVQAAQSHGNIDPTFEMTVPFWDHVPKEELGQYHIAAWQAAKRRPKKRHGGNLEKWKASVGHAIDAAAARKARKKSTPPFSSSSLSSTESFRERFLWDVESGTRYLGRRHSAKF